MKEYKIVIEMLNGEIYSNTFEKYKGAMEEYKKIKNGDLEHIKRILNIPLEMKDIHKIKFEMIEGESVKNLFTKNVNKNEIKKTCRDLVRDIDSIIDEIEKLKKHHEATILIAERKRELLLHLIGSVAQKKYSSFEQEVTVKLGLFNELALYEDKRRIAKSELRDIEIMQTESSSMNIDELLKDKPTPKIYKESTSNTRIQYEKIITYADKKEKDKFISQNKKYAYYIIDEYTNTIYFYNRFDGGVSQMLLKRELKKQDNQTKIAVKEIKELDDNEVKIVEYRTIKEKGHYQRNYKDRYKYSKDDRVNQKLYFSNQPIDLDLVG